MRCFSCVFSVSRCLIYAFLSTPELSDRNTLLHKTYYFSERLRIFGFVEREAIVGKARGVIVSFDITDRYQPRLNRFFDALK